MRHHQLNDSINRIGKKRTGRRLLILLGIIVAFVVAACDTPSPSAQQSEHGRQQSSYEKQVDQEPAHEMNYPMTRKTINFWIDTWGKGPKLAYVYLQNSAGKITGYYVLKGLPVSYCTSLSPTYDLIDTPGDGTGAKNQLVPAPAMDGVYYSGGQCNTFYGKDATSGAYIEYTAGLGINVLLYSQPLPPQKVGDAIPLGPTTTDDVKQK